MKTLSILYVVFCLSLFLFSDSFGKMYKWVDENGQTHFSDKPPDTKKATKLKEYESIEDNTKVKESKTHESPGSSNRVNPKSLNPISSIPRSQAEYDLKKSLAGTYKDAYSTQNLLFKKGMEAYDVLRGLPPSNVNIRILKRLKDTYYPYFSTILLLYKHNIKSYRELQK